MSRSPVLMVLATLAATTALLVACDSPEAPATPSVTATPTVEATTVVALPATDTATPTSTSLPEADVHAHLPAENGVLSLDPVTGEVTEVWAGPELIWAPNVYAQMADRRDGVWLSWRSTDESVRYDLDGNEVDRVPGWWPRESPNGEVVVYRQSDPARVVIRYADRSVDLGTNGCCYSPHDDGRVALLIPTGVRGENLSLSVYDPEADTTTTLVEHVGRPGKEGTIYPVWSPSGRFISDWSYSEIPTERGHAVLVDTLTGEATERSEWFTWVEGPQGEDWYASGDEGALILIDAATGEEALRITSDAGPLLASAEDLGGAFLARVGVRTGGSVTTTGAVVFDLTGNELGRWDGQFWHGAMTPAGAAAHFVDATSQSDCPSGRVEHPHFEGDLDCIGTEQAWSPDGRFLAMQAMLRTRSALLVLDTQTGETLVVDVSRDFGFEWNADSTRIMLRIGGGM
ncbi:MAG: hypothetical protein M0R75_14530 [Dehalococcoidia bacterium]|nr:hypothetical protein [Dehalococcoidia bacterium]